MEVATQEWMHEEDLNKLPRKATHVNSMIFVRHLTLDSFVLNIYPTDREGITRHIVIDMEDGRRFYEPGEDGIVVNVRAAMRGTGYEFHIVDVDQEGTIVDHTAFLVDTSFLMQ